MRQGVLHPEEDTTDVDVHDLVEVINWLLVNGDLVPGNARIVDDDVDLAEPRDGRVDRCPHLFIIADIDLDEVSGIGEKLYAQISPKVTV